MKKILFLLFLLLFCILGYSQNNGQFFENSAIRIEYMGYNFPCHLFKVTNKTDCVNNIKVDKTGGFEDYSVNGNSSITICINASSLSVIVKFKVKREGGPFCSANPDNGWVELSSPDPTLSFNPQIKILRTERLSNSKVRVLFQVDRPAKIYKIKLSLDGINYKDVQILNGNNNQYVYDLTINY